MVSTKRKGVCVISIAVFGDDYPVHQVQMCSAWDHNPYDDGWAEVPDSMVEDVLATRGYCDITVEDGVVASFVAREIPEPEPVDPEPSEMEQMRADIDYIAMEMGVDL